MILGRRDFHIERQESRLSIRESRIETRLSSREKQDETGNLLLSSTVERTFLLLAQKIRFRMAAVPFKHELQDGNVLFSAGKCTF